MDWIWTLGKHMGTTQTYEQLKRQNQGLGKVQTQTAQATLNQQTLKLGPRNRKKEKSQPSKIGHGVSWKTCFESLSKYSAGFETRLR